MNVPKYVFETIATKFNAEQTEAIDRNWFTYSNGFSFGNSSKAQILREARVVLECLNSEELAG